MIEADLIAIKALLDLSLRLLMDDIDFGQLMDADNSVLNQPEKQPRYYT